MVRILFIIGFLLLTYTRVVAQAVIPPQDDVDTDKWDVGLRLGADLSQVGLQNWSYGGQSSLAIGSVLDFVARYEKGNVLWRNNLKTEYGFQRLGKASGNSLRKNIDYLLFTTAYVRKLNKRWGASALWNFETQLTRGYNYEKVNDRETKKFVSTFMAPATSTVALGLTYSKWPIYSFSLSPIGVRHTFVLNNFLAENGLSVLPPGEKVKVDYGATFNGTVEGDVIELVKLISRLTLFSDYTFIFSKVDVEWDFEIRMAINPWLASSFTSQLRYYNDRTITRDDGTEGPAVQWSNKIKVGFVYQLGSKREKKKT